MANKCRILVVDDEVVIRELLSSILSDEGYTVDVAGNGVEAIEKLQGDMEFSLLFTDLMMPEMDGIALIHEAHLMKPDLVSIVMTGFGTLDTARAAVKEGAYDYVLKPFNLSEIKMAVHNALERSQMTNEIARLREITELFNISEKIASFRDEETLLDYVLDAALERVDATRGSLMLVSADGKYLEVVRSSGLPESATRAVVDIGGSVSGWVARNVQPILVSENGVKANIQTLNRDLPHDMSFVSVPLERKCSPLESEAIRLGLVQPRVVAVLNVSNKRNGKPFSDGDLKILSIVANHAAAALENVRLLRDMEDAQREIVFTLGEIVETRSRETGNHVKRVAEYCKVIGLKVGLSVNEAEVLRLAAPLHDVGKVGIPDAILNKPGKLTVQEFEIIKTHAQIGYDMLKVTKGQVLQSAAIIAQQHHEKFNGTGYPLGLSGKAIHIFGRITGIADVFDALGVERSYKKAWDLDRILELFCEERGRHFDPDLVDVFFENLNDILIIRDAFPDDYVDALM